MERTIVIFRKWSNGDVVALFPEIPADVFGAHCLSYEHIGQHGAADYGLVVRWTSPATPLEADDLATELKSLGYDDLIIRSRETRAMCETRFNIAAESRHHIAGEVSHV